MGDGEIEVKEWEVSGMEGGGCEQSFADMWVAMGGVGSWTPSWRGGLMDCISLAFYTYWIGLAEAFRPLTAFVWTA